MARCNLLSRPRLLAFLASDFGRAEQAIQISGDSGSGQFHVLGVHLVSDAVSPPAGSRYGGCTCPEKGIENGVADKAEHSYQTFRELQREGSRVSARGRAGYV